MSNGYPLPDPPAGLEFLEELWANASRKVNNLEHELAQARNQERVLRTALTLLTPTPTPEQEEDA